MIFIREKFYLLRSIIFNVFKKMKEMKFCNKFFTIAIARKERESIIRKTLNLKLYLITDK